jgi:hypothetical protein
MPTTSYKYISNDWFNPKMLSCSPFMLLTLTICSSIERDRNCISVYDIKKWAAIPLYERLTNFFLFTSLPVYCTMRGSLFYCSCFYDYRKKISVRWSVNVFNICTYIYTESRVEKKLRGIPLLGCAENPRNAPFESPITPIRCVFMFNEVLCCWIEWLYCWRERIRVFEWDMIFH